MNKSGGKYLHAFIQCLLKNVINLFLNEEGTVNDS